MSENTLRNKNDWSSAYNSDSTKIKWEVKGNPKRAHGKSYNRFASYFGAETVKDYIENGGTRGDLKYDWEHKFLSLEPVDEPETDEPETDIAELAAEADVADVIDAALDAHKAKGKAKSKTDPTPDETAILN